MKMLAAALIASLPVAAVAAEPLVDAEWLADNLGNEKLIVLDIRNALDKGSREIYAKGHIPGAVHSDYLKGGWRTKKGGVVGVLPDVPVLEALISELGVSDESHVVISHGGVDATDFGSAARVYWTFKYLGHDEVSILDGGWREWRRDPARPIETGIVIPEGDMFVAEPRGELLVGNDDIKASFADPNVVRVDARPLAQFLGEAKHKAAKRPGRLINAVHFDQSQLIGADGKVKDTRQLSATFSNQINPRAGQEIYSYCNTGHWAATNWFVMSEILGLENVRLFDQSMVGWTAIADNPVATGIGAKLQISGTLPN